MCSRVLIDLIAEDNSNPEKIIRKLRVARLSFILLDKLFYARLDTRKLYRYLYVYRYTHFSPRTYTSMYGCTDLRSYSTRIRHKHIIGTYI